MRVEWGSLVSLDYEILLDTGEQVDSSRTHGPSAFAWASGPPCGLGKNWSACTPARSA